MRRLVASRFVVVAFVFACHHCCRSQSGLFGSSTPKKAAGEARNPVQVFLRVRPLTLGEAADSHSCISYHDAKTISISTCVREDEEEQPSRFTFSRVFDDTSSQHEVFETTSMPLVRCNADPADDTIDPVTRGHIRCVICCWARTPCSSHTA